MSRGDRTMTWANGIINIISLETIWTNCCFSRNFDCMHLCMKCTNNTAIKHTELRWSSVCEDFWWRTRARNCIYLSYDERKLNNLFYVTCYMYMINSLCIPFGFSLIEMLSMCLCINMKYAITKCNAIITFCLYSYNIKYGHLSRPLFVKLLIFDNWDHVGVLCDEYPFEYEYMNIRTMSKSMIFV